MTSAGPAFAVNVPSENTLPHQAAAPPGDTDGHRSTGSPLHLGRAMGHRLRGAIRALLDAPALRGQTDAVRLAAVVLAAKTNAGTGTATITARGLGQWLGVSESLIDHTVLPALRRSGAVRSQPVTNARGRTSGLSCVLLPLQQARQQTPGHPLALRRTELATLLRLAEALFGPGWAPLNGRPTPPGLLSQRRGRGAPTDRLAFLLMALDTRPDGRLRMCPGTVDTQRGRPAVTIARMMGCSASGGAKILSRLNAQGVTAIVRYKTRSGLQARSHVLLPAVARAGRRAATGGTSAALGPAAHGTRSVRHHPAESVTPETRLRRSMPPTAARNTLSSCAMPEHPTSTLGDSGPNRDPSGPHGWGIPRDGVPHRPAMADLSPAGLLHTTHTPGAEAGGNSDCDVRAFSGEAVWDRPVIAGSAHAGAREDVPPQGPHWTLPGDVHRVLAAIAPLRDRLRPGELRVACAAVTAALRTFSAQRLSSDLTSQLATVPPPGQHGNCHPLRSPLGWLLAHLPPITLCPRCDRTWHGTRRGKQTCPPCTTRPAPTSGTCTNCGQTGELTLDDVCGECCLGQSLADYATRLHTQGPHNHEEGTASDTDPRSTFHQRMQETRRRAAALGLTPAGQRLAVRLAAHAEVGACPS